MIIDNVSSLHANTLKNKTFFDKSDKLENFVLDHQRFKRNASAQFIIFYFVLNH